MKVKFLCRLGKKQQQQSKELIPDSFHERVMEEITTGTVLYQETGLPPFAYFYETGQEVVGFFILLTLMEVGEEVFAEGRCYWKEGKEFSSKNFVDILKKEYKEITHLSLLHEVEAEIFSDFSNYTECFMRKRAQDTNLTDNIKEESLEESKEDLKNESKDGLKVQSKEETIVELKENTKILLEEWNETDEETIAFYHSILTDIFSMSNEEALAHREECLEDHCKIYIATRKGKKIGTCGVYLGEKSDTIFDLAICAKEQGKGYGRALLEEVLSGLEKSQKDIILQVSTKSEAAFYLYQKLGFQIEQQLVFYEVW